MSSHLSGCYGGKRAKNSLHLSHAISQKQYNLWPWFLVHLCKMMISLGFFFRFSKFWFFGLLSGGKRLKDKNWSKMRKILSVAFHISGIIHHMILLMCNMKISQEGFFIFSNFLDCYGGKRAKNSPEWQKILSVVLDISGTIHHMILIYGVYG